MDKIVYKGGGYYMGIPARDMTVEEWSQFPKAIRTAAIKQGLYKIETCKEVEAALASTGADTRDIEPCEGRNA